jgi:hypothetical protein
LQNSLNNSGTLKKINLKFLLEIMWKTLDDSNPNAYCDANRFCQEVGSLRTLCLFICTLLPVLALDLIGYAAVGGWDTFWSNDMWPFICLQMLIYLHFLFLLLVSVTLFLHFANRHFIEARESRLLALNQQKLSGTSTLFILYRFSGLSSRFALNLAENLKFICNIIIFSVL